MEYTKTKRFKKLAKEYNADMDDKFPPMKTKRNRGKQRNLDAKRSGECSDYKTHDLFLWSSDVKDWYESKSKIAQKSPNLF